MSELARKLIAENKKTRAPFLDLGNCGLTEIPEELAELEWLEELSFAQRWWQFDDKKWGWKVTANRGPENKLSSLYCKVPVFSKLVRLKILRLNGNFNVIFSIDDLSPLASLNKLQKLDISSTQVTDLAPLAELSALQELDVSDTRVGDLSPLGGLSRLLNLDVSITEVIDLSPLVGLTELQRLNVSSTQVRDLGPMSGLLELRELLISNTQVGNLAPLAGLSNLRQLLVSRTQVSDLAPLASLSELQMLNVSSTQVSDLTPLSGLSELQMLNVSSTQVSNLAALEGLSRLRELTIHSTQVGDLAPLAGLPGLQKLAASGTKVSDLAPLSEISGLRIVDVSHNLISDLLPIKRLIAKGIRVDWGRNWFYDNGIYLEGCPLTNPPAEIVKQGNAAILNYFREKETQGVDHLYEAKLLLIGEGGAGKTSLLRRLYRPGQPLPEERESTKGIDIYTHEFALKNGRRFRLNVWDFGGQEIYHATH